MDENGWIGTALDVNLWTWPKQKLWCMKLACNLRHLKLLNFCFRTEPFSSALLSFDSNISTTIGRRISWLGSFEAFSQDKNFKLSWVSIALQMRLGIKIVRICPNLALHPAVRDNLFQSLRSARHHIYHDDHQELMNLVDQEWTQKFIRSNFKPLQIDFSIQIWLIWKNLDQSNHF